MLGVVENDHSSVTTERQEYKEAKTCNIVNFFELSEEWQAEARRNLDEQAEETFYFEPNDNHNPQEHILWDLSEAMRQAGEMHGFKYNAVIGISNNTAMLLNVSDDGEEVQYIIV